MKIQWKPLLVCLAIPLGVGGLSALVTKDSMEQFAQLNQPPLSPPGWLFPVVWSVLFILMGVASYLVYRAKDPKEEKRKAYALYGLQLAVNFFWSVFFFCLGWHLFAFFWLLLLWAMILELVNLFYRISRGAGMLLLPYLAWVTFAGYLNFGIWLLN